MRIPEYKDNNSEAAQVIKQMGYAPTRWWRAIADNGTLLAESSDPKEFEAMNFEDSVKIERMYHKTEATWIEEDPS